MGKGQTDIVGHAIEFAALAHAGQYRKGSAIPYIIHPVEVAAICARITEDEATIAAGALHDVVEDTPTSVDEIEATFGRRTAEIVSAVSEDKRVGFRPDATWHERKQETIDRMAAMTDHSVLVVCMADKLSNMRSTKSELARVGDRHWERFNVRDIRAHAWYQRSLVAVFERPLGTTPEWCELNEIVELVFAGV